MKKAEELYKVTLKNNHPLKIYKSASALIWGMSSFADKAEKNYDVILTKYVNGKEIQKRQVTLEFLQFQRTLWSWSKLMKEADLWDRVGGKQQYLKHYNLAEAYINGNRYILSADDPRVRNNRQDNKTTQKKIWVLYTPTALVSTVAPVCELVEAR